MTTILTEAHIKNQYGIERLLMDNLDSGKLILVDPEMRQVGKTHALITVALANNLCIYVDNIIQASDINLRADSMPRRFRGPIAFASIDKLFHHLQGRDTRFLVDEGVRVEQIHRIIHEGTRNRREVKLSTGFFTNHFF